MAVEVIGNVQEVFDYALNKSSVSVDVLVITKKEFIEKLSNPDTIKPLFVGLSQLTSVEQFKKLLQNEEIKDALKEPINPKLLKEATQSIQEFFSSFSQVELKNYSFVNSMNSDSYTISVRTKNGIVFSVEYVEKHQIQQALEEVFFQYIYSISSYLNIDELEFQIEIKCFSEIKKYFALHKQGQKLLLFSQYAHPQLVNGCIYHIKGEQYSSYENMLFFNKATQDMKFYKEGSKMTFAPISVDDRVLLEQELIAIHEATSSLNDVSVEGFINSKGKIELTYVSVLNYTIEHTYENNLLLHKSSKKYNEVSLLPVHEISTQTPNPKYILIRNLAEYTTCIELLRNETIKDEIDGIILSFALYSKQLLYICNVLDIDCIISKNMYDKMLQTTINWEDLEIEGMIETEKNNPFSSLLPQKSQEEVMQTQRLKDVQEELNSQISSREQDIQHSSNGFENFSTNRPITTSSHYSQESSNNSQDVYSHSNTHANGQKKSALAMLADDVLVQTSKPIPQEEVQKEEKQYSNTNEHMSILENPSTQESKNSSFDLFSLNPLENQEMNATSHSAEYKEVLKEYLAFKQQNQENEKLFLEKLMKLL